MHCWQSVVISLYGLSLQNMFTMGKDSDDNSIYEMMCTAGEWRNDGEQYHIGLFDQLNVWHAIIVFILSVQ